ncbi:MAG TPA: flagellar hook-length control protein FliK, partial [Roseateles sp.]|nr:flagellar hook-length control protein FliK [Roseateles sp.]
QAELHLNPSEMGPVQVQIVVDGQQAQVSFHSDQAETRAVLERSLPELASALRDSGLTLSGGGVFQQAQDQGRPAPQSAHGASSRAAHGAALEDTTESLSTAATLRPQPRARGVVDLYA